MQERDVVAVVSGGPYARVDAHVAHHSADDEFPYARPAEGVVEIRLEESVRRVFDDDGLAVQRLDRAVYLGTGRIRQEEGRAGTGVDMPDVENGPVLFAETPQRQPGFRSPGVCHTAATAAMQPRICTLGKTLVLVSME